MRQIQVSDALYAETQMRAAEAGFASVDEYIADLVDHHLHDNPQDFEYLFTPERLAHIDGAVAEIKAGKGCTPEQVNERLAAHRAEWLQRTKV